MINTLSASTCELGDEYSNSPVSDVLARNFYFQVNFINFYLREIISFTKEIDIRDWGQSTRDIVREIHRTQTGARQQNTKLSKATSSLSLSLSLNRMIAKLERSLRTTLQNKYPHNNNNNKRTHWEQQHTMNQHQHKHLHD